VHTGWKRIEARRAVAVAVAGGLVGRIVIKAYGAATGPRAVSRKGLVGLMDGLSIRRNEQKCWLKNVPFDLPYSTLDGQTVSKLFLSPS